jgi:hypothetical protein
VKAYYVLFNGSVFWLSPGVFSSDVNDATQINTEDSESWIRDVGSIDGFYPLLIVGKAAAS